jgi:dienelactone hydrolase
MQILKILALGLAGSVLLAALAWWGIGGSAGLVQRALPDFPDFPSPLTRIPADHAGKTYFESATPFDFDVILDGMGHALPTTGVGTLVLPEGASADAPVPAMVILHGSGGQREAREQETARRLAANGIAGFVVDYYAPRGFVGEQDYMLRVLSVTEFDAVADAYGALRHLSSHPAIDGERIGVMGFSYGGMATRIAMDERVRRMLTPGHPGFATYIDVYGPCFQQFGTRESNGGELLTLRGTEDRSNDLEACAEREAELRAIGVPVETHVFEGAGHAWEAQFPQRMGDTPYVAGCTMVYDERGHSSVNGVPIADVPVATSRNERIALRVASGASMSECVGTGYLIGRDDEAAAKSSAAIDAFLARTLSPAS